jgi:hypothetical protein
LPGVSTTASRWCGAAIVYQLSAWRICALFLLLLSVLTRHSQADVVLDARFANLPIQIKADTGETWREGSLIMWSLRNGVEIVQGENRITGREAVLWIEPGGTYGTPPWKIRAYVEGQVTILSAGRVLPATAKPEQTGSLQPSDRGNQSWLGQLVSVNEPRFHIAQMVPHQPQTSTNTATVLRAQQRLEPQAVPNLVVQAGPASAQPGTINNAVGQPDPRTGLIQPTQYAEFPGEASRQPVLANPTPTTTRSIQVFPRSGVKLQAEYFPAPGGSETVVVINSGVQVRIDGLVNRNAANSAVGALGNTIDISADRVVIWSGGNPGRLETGSQQSNDTPLEIYMEGDIVFREGDRVIYAQAMYYNVPLRNGVILNAELLSPVPNYAGMVRLRANVLRQLDEANFVADGASLTTSRLAMPSYEFRAGQMNFTDQQFPVRDPVTMLPVVDPATGEPVVDHQTTVTSSSNVVMAGGLPVFYWPRLVTDLEKPTFYVNDIQIGSDQIFGTRGTVTFDAYQLFGFRSPPKGTDWDIDVGYMSERGFNGGTRFNYNNDFISGGQQRFAGLWDLFYINDGGRDTLGSDRVNMIPEETNRYRVLGRHRQQLDNGWQLSAQVGLISDRNFLEQYFERDWDEQKDADTGIELKRIFDNQSLALSIDYNPNEFFLRTQQLPRLDYFNLGSSWFDNRLTSYLHGTASYNQVEIASTPLNAADAATFSPLPYERAENGEKAAVRAGIELPLPVMDTKVVPFLLGEAGHWGSDINGDDIQRLYGQAGIRTSLPFWSVMPDIESELWNVHGVAHKTSLNAEYSYTDSSRNVEEFLLYDEIDDDNTQHFRRRLAFQEFGGAAPVPPQYDERFYGVRRGLMDSVTGPSEIVDDLQVARFGWHNRWQTKRGPEGNRRIIDWIIFDTNFELFPDANDNFGEHAGLVDYDFRWHVGDRVTLLSSGAADFFGDGQRFFTFGASINRPARGNIYVGFRSLEGPISSNILLATLNYRMSPKWVGSAGVSFDLGSKGYLGQSASVSRIGESFIATVAFNADQTRDNIGVMFYLEPRFLPRTRFGKRTGLDVPLAGQYGLE